MTRHYTEPGRRIDRLAAHWTETGWPVLAGALTATGLMGALGTYGLLATALIFIGLWVFAAITVYGTCSESGITPGRAVRLGLAGTHVIVVLMGLLELFPVGGWLAAAVVALTSPVVTSRLVRRLRRDVVASRPQDPDVRPDQPAVDRLFAQIVAELEDRTSGPEPT